MTVRGLWASVGEDLRRHWRHLGAGGLGIAMSIAALTFFLALGLGVRDVLLGEVFSLDRIEVHRPGKDLNLLAVKVSLGKDTIDDEVVAELAGLEGVAEVFPKMRLMTPAMASGGESLIGQGMQTELVADGIDPALVSDEIGDAFHDPRSESPDLGRPCGAADPCPDDLICAGASRFRPGICREEIPVIVSQHMVELYNGAFRRAYRLPKVNPGALRGLGLDVRFGASSLRPSRARVVDERLVLVGFSDTAIPLGVTMPLGFVRRLNRELGPRGSGEGFHSAVVELESQQAAASVIREAEALGLEVTDGGARRAALVMNGLLATVSLVGLVILTISAIHVLHVFTLLGLIRRREIAVMRAVGASRSDVRLLFLTEAAVVGTAAGGLGLLAATVLAWAAGRGLDSFVPDFPFKPETFFSFEPWIVVCAVGIAVLACVLGALAPALRATSSDPAEILGGD